MSMKDFTEKDLKGRMKAKTKNSKSWSDYLKRLADDKVSNLLLSLMFLFDALQFAYGGAGRNFFYISLLPLAADFIWCDLVLYKRKVQLSSTVNMILKYSTYAIWAAIAVLVVIGIIR